MPMIMTAEWIQHSSGDCDNCADDNHNHVNGVHDGSVDDGDGGGGDLAARLRGCSQLAAQQYNTIQRYSWLPNTIRQTADALTSH